MAWPRSSPAFARRRVCSLPARASSQDPFPWWASSRRFSRRIPSASPSSPRKGPRPGLGCTPQPRRPPGGLTGNPAAATGPAWSVPAKPGSRSSQPPSSSSAQLSASSYFNIRGPFSSQGKGLQQLARLDGLGGSRNGMTPFGCRCQEGALLGSSVASQPGAPCQLSSRRASAPPRATRPPARRLSAPSSPLDLPPLPISLFGIGNRGPCDWLLYSDPARVPGWAYKKGLRRGLPSSPPSGHQGLATRPPAAA